MAEFVSRFRCLSPGHTLNTWAGGYTYFHFLNQKMLINPLKKSKNIDAPDISKKQKVSGLTEEGLAVLDFVKSVNRRCFTKL